MMSGDDIALRAMEVGDLEACLALSKLAGWNQLLSDWEIFRGFRPAGCFVALAGRTVVGTVTTIDYDSRFSWIGMVIVHPDCRRRGIGTRLLRRAIESLASCESIKLDATPSGKKVYDRLGFADEYGLVRMVGSGKRPAAESPSLCALVEPLTPACLAEVVEFDAPLFGAERGCVLEQWFARSPEYAFVLKEGNTIRGYCLGRPGANYETIGPLAALDEEAALALVGSALRAVGPRAVCIDVFDHSPTFGQRLEALGLSCQRPFIRMVRGPNRYPGVPDRQWAVCGPEVG